MRDIEMVCNRMRTGISQSYPSPSTRRSISLKLLHSKCSKDANAFLASSQQASRPTKEYSTVQGHVWSKAIFSEKYFSSFSFLGSAWERTASEAPSRFVMQSNLDCGRDTAEREHFVRPLQGNDWRVLWLPRAALRDVPSLRSALGYFVAAPFGANRNCPTSLIVIAQLAKW